MMNTILFEVGKTTQYLFTYLTFVHSQYFVEWIWRIQHGHN